MRLGVWSSSIGIRLRMASTQQTQAVPVMVTGYDELRASLAERKNWRRAKKIDDTHTYKKSAWPLPFLVASEPLRLPPLAQCPALGASLRDGCLLLHSTHCGPASTAKPARGHL